MSRREEPPAALAPQIQRLRRSGLPPLEIVVDGEPLSCFEGETIAVVLLADRAVIGRDRVRAHGLWCGIGVCFECVVAVDGSAGVRACMTPVRPGLRIETMSEHAGGGAGPAGDGRDRGDAG